MVRRYNTHIATNTKIIMKYSAKALNNAFDILIPENSVFFPNASLFDKTSMAFMEIIYNKNKFVGTVEGDAAMKVFKVFLEETNKIDSFNVEYGTVDNIFE